MSAKKFEVSKDLKSLIKFSFKNGHRFLLFLFNLHRTDASHGQDQVMIIHHLLTKHSKSRPNVLWCLKSESKDSKVSKSILKALEKKLRSGQCDISAENAFHVFLLSCEVKYCFWSDVQSIMGKTFDMLVIQDFEALTPNILCQVIETVGTGGAIVFILPPHISGLKDLSHLTMDAHSKLKTGAGHTIQPRFNERFTLSLNWCKSRLILDSNLKSSNELSHFIKEEPNSSLDSNCGSELNQLIESLADAEKPLPQLIGLCRTLDQAKAVLKMIDVVTDKHGRSTVSITAGRGRGKSAALGLATAAAIYFGINNIYVSSPTPENLSTFFEFAFKGFDALDYTEGEHYSIVQSTNPEFKGSLVRVSIFARHRQTIQYICPSDYARAIQAELVIVDEAASIPLPYVKALLGSHNVFMASTINGYEGTGRSLSLKLLKELRQQSVPLGAKASSTDEAKSVYSNCRPLHEVSLEESIRYRPGDPVEKWLNRLLCLDAPSFVPPVFHCPHAETCQLFYVNRDVLFSGHSDSEDFLNRILSLLVSSHYKNCPDDLLTLADSPTHHVFVLAAPSPDAKDGDVSCLPPVFAVVQVSIEGGITSETSESDLQRSQNTTSGNLIPWTLNRHLLDSKFLELVGIRIVRIATHADYQSMGYGSRAIRLLKEYYEGAFANLDGFDEPNLPLHRTQKPSHDDSPLLMKLSERKPEEVDYLGVSFGLTEQLFRFWKKSQFIPLHISQTANKITGEHNCIMVYPVTEDGGFSMSSSASSFPEWMVSPPNIFLGRFLTLLSGPFRSFPTSLCRIIASCFIGVVRDSQEIGWSELEFLIGGHDLKRLDSYSKNLSDRNLITDLLQPIALLFFSGRLPGIHLSNAQMDLILGCGLQLLHIDGVSESIGLPIESALGQFNRALKRLFKRLTEIQESNVTALLPQRDSNKDYFTPVSISLDNDLDVAAQEFDASMKRTVFGDVSSFAVKGTEQEWSRATSADTVVTIKSKKRAPRMTETEFSKELESAQPSKQRKKRKK